MNRSVSEVIKKAPLPPTDISIVNPALLEKVDFLTGGFPAKYGDKMSSVFDMSLKDGNRELYNQDRRVSSDCVSPQTTDHAFGGSACRPLRVAQ